MKLPSSLKVLSMLALSVLPACGGQEACLFQVAQEGRGKNARVILNHSAAPEDLCDVYYNKRTEIEAIVDACKLAGQICCGQANLCGDVNEGMQCKLDVVNAIQNGETIVKERCVPGKSTDIEIR